MNGNLKMSKHIILMVGPAGSGKSTMAHEFRDKLDYVYINQDLQGREHLSLFDNAILAGLNVIVDRLNFTKGQRARYLDLAKSHGYTSKIIVLHQSYEVCLERCLTRVGHETIKEERASRGALNMFFSRYERVEDTEADAVERHWPTVPKPRVVWVDLDGTLCNVEHRKHLVSPPENSLAQSTERKINVSEQSYAVELNKGSSKSCKDWAGFFKAMVNDTTNEPVMYLLKKMNTDFVITYCSGRPNSFRKETQQWLLDNDAPKGLLFMRMENDRREDSTVKEILLDFEILTRYSVFLCLEDRSQVVKMLRNRGLTTFQVAEGDF
jgi:predicted kinase